MSIADYYNKLEAEGRLEEAFTLLVEQGIPDPNQAAELLNKISIGKLHEDDLESAHYYLKRAQELTCSSKIKAITYNNLACYYRRLTKFRIALSYLEKALSLDNSADTRLNMCAVLSHSGKHSQALEQALHALVLIQEQIIEENDPVGKAPLLAVGFHNLAVELEYLNRLSESHSYYSKAAACVKKYCDPNHSVYISIMQAFESFRMQQGVTQKKSMKEKLAKRSLRTAIHSVTRNTPTSIKTRRIIFKENRLHRKSAQGVIKAALESSTAKLWGSVQNMPPRIRNKFTNSLPKNIDRNVGLNIQTDTRIKSDQSYDSEVEMKYDSAQEVAKSQSVLSYESNVFNIRTHQPASTSSVKLQQEPELLGNLPNLQTKLSTIPPKPILKSSQSHSSNSLQEESKLSSQDLPSMKDDKIFSNPESSIKQSIISETYLFSPKEVESDINSPASYPSHKSSSSSSDAIDIPEDNSSSSDRSKSSISSRSSSNKE